MKEHRPEELAARRDGNDTELALSLSFDEAASESSDEPADEAPSPGKRSRAAELYALGAPLKRRGPRKPGGSNYAAQIYGGVRARQARAMRLAAAPAGVAAAVDPRAEERLGRLSRRGGVPLADDVRASVEALFGHDFAHVRVHADAEAATAAADVNARAFTIGSDLYFGLGAFAPGTDAGDRLLVHELTHVVQHDQGRLPASSGGIEVSHPSEATEQEAVAMEGRAAAARIGAGGAAAASAAPASSVESDSGPTRASRSPEPDGGQPRAGTRSAASGEPGGRASRNILDDIASWGTDQFKSVLRRVSPGLADLIDQGPGALLKNAVQPAISSWVGSVTGGLNLGAIGDITKSFQSTFALLQGAKNGDAKCCETLVNGINAIREAAMAFLHNPAFEAIKSALSTVTDIIGKVSKLVLAPVFDAVKEIVGGAWTAIKAVATTINGWFQTAKDYASKLFDWVAQQLGFSGATGEGGILDWLKEKVAGIWDSIKETLAPIAGPLKTVGTVLFVLTPMGQIAALVKYGPKVVEAVEWLWANRSNPNIVKDAHAQMGNSILPKILDVGSGFVGTVKSAVTWLSSQITSFSTSLLELLGGLSGIPLLGMAQGFVRSLQTSIQSVQEWAAGAFHSAADTVGDIYQKTADFIRPYKEVLCSIGLCIVSPGMIPAVLAGWAWRWLPDCIKPPIVDLLLDIVLEVVGAIPVLPMFGLLWPMLKPAVMGFLRGVRSQSPEAKIQVTNKLAKIISGASPEFLFGFVKGFLKGIWDGIKMPFELIWMLAEGMTKVTEYFGLLGDEAEVHATRVVPVTPSGIPATPAAAPPSPGATASATTATRPAPPSPPGGLTADNIVGSVAGYAASLRTASPQRPRPVPASPGAVTAPVTPGVASPAAAAQPQPDGNRDRELAADARRMAGDLAQPIGTVTSGFWPAVKSLFQGGGIGTLDDLVSKLGRIWEMAQAGISGMAGELAGKIFSFFMGDGAEQTIGDTVGYIVGMFAFQAVLDYFTAGAGAAIPVLSQIAKFLNWPMKALEEVMVLLKTLGKYVIGAVKEVGSMLAQAGGALRQVLHAFGEIGEKLIVDAEQLLAKFGGRAEGQAAHAAEAEAARLAEAEAARVAEAEAARAAEAEAARAAEAEGAAAKGEASAAEREASAAEREALKAEELAEVEIEVQAIKLTAQAAGVPAQLVAVALDGLKARYSWINHFEMRPRSGQLYELHMIASDHDEGPYEDREDPVIAALRSRIATEAKFELTYTQAELERILAEGRAMGLTERQIEDMLFVGSRRAKPINADELIQQMRNYTGEVVPREYPYLFESRAEFERFQSELTGKLRECGLPTGDVRIQGSSLRTPAARDVDVAIMLDDAAFNQQLVDSFAGKVRQGGQVIEVTPANLEEVIARIRANPAEFNATADTLEFAFTHRKIRPQDVPGLRAAKKALEREFGELDISIMSRNGGFNIEPFMGVH